MVHIEDSAIVAVKGTNFINQGEVTHEGYLLVDYSIINHLNWSCSARDSNTIELGSNWVNNGRYFSGIGAVNLIGGTQEISGDSSSQFFILNLMGPSMAIKSLWVNSSVENRLNLYNAELACNHSTMLMKQKAVQIERQNGFVSTKISGRLNRELSSSLNSSLFPLGYNNNGKIVYRPIYTDYSNTGVFRTAFLYDNASNFAMNTNLLQDSICTVNEEYFHIIGSTFKGRVSIDIVTDQQESWTKMADWGDGWKKIELSGPSTLNNKVSYQTSNYLNGEDRAVVMATERPFVQVEPLVYVPFKSSYSITPKYHAPINSIYSWSPPQFLSCDNCPAPEYTAGMPETYTIEVDNGVGCIAIDTIEIIVVRGEDNPILIPNAFTPNGDMLNEVFKPYLYPFEKLVSFSIYNRWGEKIYEGLDGWDGRYKGNLVPTGAYMYMAEVREIKAGGYFQRNHLSGTVTVLR